MPIYLLDPEDPQSFPPPDRADASGLLAVGGDLSPERLLTAYSQGIFPWYSEGQPLLWHSPNPRFVLEPDKLHVGRSLRKTMKAGTYEVRWDTAFEQVISACSETPRPGQNGTWITDAMLEAYVTLHHLGFAHSVEAWADGELKGGLYGVSLGAAFFGESMFAHAPDASKVAFATSVERLKAWGFHFIDCQVETEHLARFGAEPWPRRRFLGALAQALEEPTRRGPWT
ncbi:leucyl/phenylalanyl-tRNA--protein transferase [Stigmatella aurantiaca]|uniref:Leucyl/phenylalanyl-tRNA--protein transferase n=1 Tax=Stigmatella aurantiaca (strain DW4/3-1) TaxID=378806 RepID=Q093U6_STIAD|nr:leucyl/phenylalanyl-tRNA--protein transferase [Stigmatella aurantiaca]ADO69740.1 Leucyl/phenylalanyl-tRNA-protein transferase [Stigmatella aurantiaca DW4/3-1]EAU67026.1 leucyl/phenylalanyl-tRNA--protein transferase [Stigmatella aurantiaca DW4/3-1]